MNEVKIYNCKDGRTRVYIKKTHQVISYPKYLMEQKLGRKIHDDEQIHHKDGNPLNNDLDNLEIRLIGEHQKEHSTKFFDKEATCQWCGKKFLWTAKQQSTFYANQKRKNRISHNNPFCSKQCAGKFGKYIQSII